MRLIDADTIDDMVQDLNENHNSEITRNEYKRIIGVLYEMPTIDAVPVVRCKDCQGWQTDWIPVYANDGEHYCPHIDRCTGPDWFCADGEWRC